MANPFLCAVAAGLVLMVPLNEARADDTGVAQLLHGMKREGKRLCLDGHFHSGESSGMPSKKAAEIEAIRSWAGFTAFEYGTDWAQWTKAASKSMGCTQGSSGWGCVIEARPCK
jgi:hypothetical protein